VIFSDYRLTTVILANTDRQH